MHFNKFDQYNDFDQFDKYKTNIGATSDLEIMVDAGILDPRKDFGWQKVFSKKPCIYCIN